MSRRADGLHKPVVILAGVFANGLLSTVEQRFAVRLVGDEFIDFDNVDFTNVSLAIVFGCGHRIAERHLNKATFINLHGSLLPLGRGPHPHIWSWINGEPHGVTIHKMSAEIDRGPVIVQRKVELEPWESSINSTIYPRRNYFGRPGMISQTGLSHLRTLTRDQGAVIGSKTPKRSEML